MKFVIGLARNYQLILDFDITNFMLNRNNALVVVTDAVYEPDPEIWKWH